MSMTMSEAREGPPQLFLATLGADWDPARDRVAGPWCFLGLEERYPDWDLMPFPEIPAFVDETARTKAVGEVEHLVRYLIGVWAGRMNSRHDTQHGLGYWWTMLVRWILPVVSAAYRRWMVMEALVDQWGSDTLDLPVTTLGSDFQWDFVNTNDVVNRGLSGLALEALLWRLVAEAQKPPTWRLVHGLDYLDTLPSRPLAEPLMQGHPIKRLARRLLGDLRAADTAGLKPFDILLFSGLLRLLPARTGRTVFRGAAPASPPEGLAAGLFDVIDRLLEATIPRTLGPDYAAHAKAAERLPVKAGKLRMTSQATANDAGNFFLARAIEAGERVIRFQHGSDYGETDHHLFAILPEYVDAHFLTWGWTDSGQPDLFHPLPVPSFARYPLRTGPGVPDIVLVGSKTWIRTYRVDQAPEPVQCLRYRRAKLAFINALAPAAGVSFAYRPYERGVTDLADSTFFQSRLPGLAMVEGDLHERLLKAGLVVLDHPGTTLNMTMALRIPTLCFWAQDTWPYTERAKPLFDALSRVGVVHSEPEKAAAFINNRLGGGDPKVVWDWWRSEPVSSAVAVWAAAFAWRESGWRRHWFRQLKKL